MNIKIRLIILSFLQFAVWGAYLTSMGNYLGSIGLGQQIGLFYAMQGFVSILMPAIMGIIAPHRSYFLRSGGILWNAA